MTGEYYITKELLKQYKPCTDGYRWFCEHYPNGGKYQEILDRLCDDNRVADAHWLLDRIGVTDDVLEIDTLEDANKNICFAGSVVVENDIKVKTIEAGRFIRAGGYIEAGEFIKAGEDYGIYAGLNISLSRQKEHGYITADSKPDNIMCGYWKKSEST